MSTPGLPDPLPPIANRAIVLNGVAIGLLIPAIIILAIRMGVRAFITKNLGIDDWLMLAAAPFLITDQVLSIVSTNYGVGQHVFYLSGPDLTGALKMNTIAQPFNIVALFLIKASIVSLLIRLKLPRSYRIILFISVGLLFTVSLMGVITAFAQCRPFALNWDLTLPGHCWSRNIFQDTAYVLQGLTIVTDIFYITIPMIFLWNVQIARSLKIGILGVISLGVVSMACSIVAIPFVQELGASIDVTWVIVNLAAIKIGEANVAMMVGCIPPMQPLFKKVNDRYFSRNTKTGETYEGRLERLKLKPSEYEMLSGRTKGSSHNRSQNDKLTNITVTSNTYVENETDYVRRSGNDPRPLETV